MTTSNCQDNNELNISMNKRSEIFPPFQHESMILVGLHVLKREVNERSPPSTFFNAGHKKPATKILVLKN